MPSKDSRDSAKRAKANNAGSWVGGLVGIVLLTLTGLGYYFSANPKQQPEDVPDFQQGEYQNVSSRLTAWLSNSKTSIEAVKQQIEKVKQLGQQDSDAEQAVHFEFYNTLPSMKVARHHSDMASQVKLAAEKSFASTPSLSAEAAGRSMFLDPKELEEDFAQVIPRQGYVLQLATFSQLGRAELYRSKLTGYEVEIIKAYVGDRQVYRVQVGPFSNRDEVKQTEKVLKKKGYAGIVRKIQMG